MIHNEIPKISITHDDAVDIDNDQDDNNYNIKEAHTDIEDLDSDNEQKRPKSPCKMLKIRKKKLTNECATDIEDYNDSGSDLEPPKIDEDRVSLSEFLDQGYVEETSTPGAGHGKSKKTSNSAGLCVTPIDDGALTDCENVETSDEDEEVPNEKMSEANNKFDSFLLNSDDFNTVSVQGSSIVNSRKQCRSSTSNSPSNLSDSDDDQRRFSRFDVSDVEDIMFSDDNGAQKYCGKMKHSVSALDAEEITLQDSDNEDVGHRDSRKPSYPEINIQFLAPGGSVLRHRKNKSKKIFNKLAVHKEPDEILTDIENLNSSDEDEDDDSKSNLAIPAAICSHNLALTDVEDLDVDDDVIQSCSKDVKLPSPVREITVMTEDKQGDPIAKVMPLLNTNMHLGVTEPYMDKGLTDTEDVSGNEEDYNNAGDYETKEIPSVDGGSVRVRDGLVEFPRRKFSNVSDAEPLTECEELHIGKKQHVRRKKSKPKSARPRQFLNVSTYKDNRPTTDVEELYVSDDQIGNIPMQTRRNRSNRTSLLVDIDAIKTDTEDISGDEDGFDKHMPDIDPLIFRQEAFFSTVTSSDGSTGNSFTQRECYSPIPMIIHKNHGSPQTSSEQSADTEDLQINSDTEDLLTVDTYSRANTVTPQAIRNALNENSNFLVLDRNNSHFDTSNEGAHIKGYQDIQESHTDVEFLDDDVLQNKPSKSKMFFYLFVKKLLLFLVR